MKNIAYRIIMTAEGILVLPAALMLYAGIILVAAHNVFYTYLKLTFNQNDPYEPMRNLAAGARNIVGVFDDMYHACSKFPRF